SQGKARLKDIGQNAMPRLRSGLKLQRCGGEEAAVPPKTAITAVPTKVKWPPQSSCGPLQTQIETLLGQAIPTVDSVISRLATPKNVEKQLMKNFRLPATDPKVATVVQVLQGVSEAMRATASGAAQTPSLGDTPRFECLTCDSDVFAGTSNACINTFPLLTGFLGQTGKLVSRS